MRASAPLAEAVAEGDRLLRECDCKGEAACSVEQLRECDMKIKRATADLAAETAELNAHKSMASSFGLAFESIKNIGPEDLRSALSLVELLTSLKRRRPPTEPLLRRKFDALPRSVVERLPFMVESVVAARHGRLTPHERDGMARAVCDFPAETAAESAHVHACGAAASEEAVGFAHDQASHLLRIGLEHRAAARGMGLPLCPVATDLHTLAMAELERGAEDSEKAALGRLGVCGATVLEGGYFASAAGLLIGTAFCVAVMDQVGGSRGAVCCGTCHRVARGDALTTCRRCGEHLFCAACSAGDGPARHANECERVRSRVRGLAQSMLPRVRESTRRVAVVQLSDSGVVAPMHITRIASPLVPSSLLEALCRGSTTDPHCEIIVYWRLLVAFLAQPEGDAQELVECERAVHRVDPAERTVAYDRAGAARKAPTLRPSEKRRLQKESRAAERKAEDDARAAAAALAVAEADAVLERQAARPDATSAMLTRVLAKREGAASPKVVARARAKRDSLKVAERAARRPAKARPDRGAVERVGDGAELGTDARSAAARLLQRHARAWLRGRRKLRRKERSRAAKRLQRSVRAWLPSVAVAATPPSPAQSGNEADDQDQTLCVVCLERPRVMLFLACAHLCACEECAPLMMGSCPLCRAEGATLRVYT